MEKINRLKIISLALYHSLLPKWIKHKVHFKATPIEHLAIGTMMTKIKYWKHFIRKDKSERRITFNKKNDEPYYFKTL